MSSGSHGLFNITAGEVVVLQGCPLTGPHFVKEFQKLYTFIFAVRKIVSYLISCQKPVYTVNSREISNPFSLGVTSRHLTAYPE